MNENFAAGTSYPNTTFAFTDFSCNASGVSTISFEANGSVSAPLPPLAPAGLVPPFPGTFHETGTLTMTGMSGPLLSLNTAFQVTDASNTQTVSGTTTFSGPAVGLPISCVPGTPTTGSLSLGIMVPYVATTSLGPDNGQANLGINNGQLEEHFGPPVTPPPSSSVTGTVTGPGGSVFQPPTNAGVAACPANVPLAQNCPGFVSTPADPNHGGSYVLNLSPGSYNVVGFAFINGQPLATSIPVLVTLGQGQTVTENFTVTPPPPPVPAIVTGIVTLSGPVPPGTTYGVVMCMAQFNTTCAITSPAYLTVTPNSGLFDGEIVSLSGTGPGGAPGGTTVRECAPATGCDFSTNMPAVVRPDGTVGPIDYTVHQHLNVGVGPGGPTVPVDCAVSPCEIEFYNGGPTPNGGGAPISFAGGISAAHPSSEFAFADPSGHYSLSQGLAAPFVVQGFALIGGDPNHAIMTAPVVVTLVPGQTITQNFVINVPPVAKAKDDCKNGGWQHVVDNQGRPFKNQGDCVSFVATGGKNLAAG